MKILIIDDEEVVLEFFQELLAEDDYSVSVAKNGEEGLEVMGREFFNLLIVDKNLPGINGLEVIRKAKKLSPDTEAIMVTGYASFESVTEALELGVISYITKPFEDITKVKENIKRALEKQDNKFKFRKKMEEMTETNKRLTEFNQQMQAELERLKKLREE
ncbi:MAG: response regulator [Deltaproteobacteria bacterium]|nr:MAG: response regulator [Deltaproteobacteria bacterium]